MAKSKIATAYVQVAPSMEGFAPKVKSMFGASGKRSGSSFGSNFVSTFKNMLVAAGIGTAVKQGLESSLTAGAGLEQSLGGVETLFKGSADAVIAAADNAFRTAGMSANSYMETVTGFSASLLQSLGGDTQQAAAVADMALTDMSDNANKMGTAMESIQDAYQGFAKQNYTMLDNLKLGYGGTKTEMERLLDDAQKLTGVKYDISNLSDVYSAIHAIQTEIGITGTTAKEASTTLTGSFNAMKASFSNVLGNLALGRDMQPSLDALAETTTTFLTGNLVPAVWNIVTALPGSLSTFLNSMIPANIGEVTDTAITEFNAMVDENLPGILESGGQTLLSFVKGISARIPDLMSMGTNVATTFGTYIAENPDVIIEAAGTVFGNLLLGLAECLPQLATTALDIVVSFATYLVENRQDLAEAGLAWAEEITSALWDGIVEGWNRIKPKLESLFGSLIISPSSSPDAMASVLKPGISRHSGGLSYVPYDGYLAVLHQGERVLTSGEAIAYRNNGSTGRSVTVIQNIHSTAKTAADLMEEARYQQEEAELFGV